ncbi:hypothetical protein N798_13045 [Knoellia flava TL1]|uniref:DUF5063 domain-containing protein n=2 Tax=Knoellia flava TaxID=913969 RepID=A0A8H9FU58_9MICO|nr:DUF5063 domain-containing protein [Knoellia flava]KGN29469.1 hypothetical protein N798_13045 [Knoellia flava TL1]MDT0213984.1 DUF5063 domain-containing protein [Rothia sp. ARF10]GGB76274.1 DUF5063 domain-containing protein [Knoellia flava]
MPDEPAGPDAAAEQQAADTMSDLRALADDSAHEARTYLATVTDIASGANPAAALPLGLLALSQVLVMGARLGAIEDIVPEDRFEVDPGPDVELDPLRESLTNLLEGLDEYADVVDPVTEPELTTGSVSNDLTVVASALAHGLRHYDEGRILEALWWWQFSYLSDWGERAASALRVLQALLAHVRLDADADAVSEAEFDALHP